MINKKEIDNNIELEGAMMISEALKSNSTLTRIWLGGDEKEEKEIRINNKEIKKCEGEIMIKKMIYKWNK